MGDPGRVSSPESSAAFEVRGLVKRYRGKDRPANDRIDLTVPSSQIMGLLGPNGAGKSTFVRQLVGILRPDEGRIVAFGRDLGSRAGDAGRWVAYLAQEEPALAELPVRVAVETTARLRGLSRPQARTQAESLIDELGLEAVAESPLVKISGGQRRLAALAAALAGDRTVLVLDEPTTGLDPLARRRVWQALGRRRDRGTTVILVTHNVTEAESVLDQVAVLNHGRVIACDTPGRLKASISEDVRLDIVWRVDPPLDDAVVSSLRSASVVFGRRWSARLPVATAQQALLRLTVPPLVSHLDDFTLCTPSLEDVYLAAGVGSGDLERV